MDDVVSLSCCQLTVESIFEEVEAREENACDSRKVKENFVQQLKISNMLWPWDPGGEELDVSEPNSHLDLVQEASGEMSISLSPHSQDAHTVEELEILQSTASSCEADVLQVISDEQINDNLGAKLKEELQTDPDLKFLKEWFINKEEPPENILFAASPAAKY